MTRVESGAGRALRLVARARGALLVVSLLGAFYLTWRVDFLRLPRAGCSPVLRFAPGVLLVVDGHPPRVFEDDVVLFADGPALLIGIVARLGAPGPDAGPPLWIVTDDETCSGRGSDELGWIPRDALRGRVLFALPL
jgi:hypothetical protein